MRENERWIEWWLERATVGHAATLSTAVTQAKLSRCRATDTVLALLYTPHLQCTLHTGVMQMKAAQGGGGRATGTVFHPTVPANGDLLSLSSTNLHGFQFCRCSGCQDSATHTLLCITFSIGTQCACTVRCSCVDIADCESSTRYTTDSSAVPQHTITVDCNSLAVLRGCDWELYRLLTVSAIAGAVRRSIVSC